MLVNDNIQSRIVLKGAGIIKITTGNDESQINLEAILLIMQQFKDEEIIILPVPYLDFAS